ncbi:C2 domain-containing protein, partial [Baffinella frigidus]
FYDVGFVLQTHMMVRSLQPVSLKEWKVEGEMAGDSKRVDPLAFLKTRYKGVFAKSVLQLENVFAKSVLQLEGVFAKSVLQLEVVKARNLPKADDGPLGLSDPFCTLLLNTMERSTRVISRNLNPEFNETFFFEDQQLGVWPSQTIEIKVFDFDVTSAPDLLGSIKIPVADLLEKENKGAQKDMDAEENREDEKLHAIKAESAARIEIEKKKHFTKEKKHLTVGELEIEKKKHLTKEKKHLTLGELEEMREAIQTERAALVKKEEAAREEHDKQGVVLRIRLVKKEEAAQA